MRVASISGLSARKRDGIFHHVFSNKDREVAGVLVGEHFEDGSLWVADHIPAEEADERAAAVTFTHESWDRILKIKDTDFAELEIVGWYHSHPGYGLFLSNDDLFMHENFFPAWWQIAYVVDPINEEGGIFVWEDSSMEMFERHEATFTGTQAASPSPVDETPFPAPSSRGGLSTRLAPEGALGVALAVGGVILVLIILGFVLLGSGEADKETPTVLPTKEAESDLEPAVSPDSEAPVIQFPRKSEGKGKSKPPAIILPRATASDRSRQSGAAPPSKVPPKAGAPADQRGGVGVPTGG